ncbi:GTPase HflX [Pseudobacteriovorax antillogorgiicola]|uniref:GTPase HflX n=1 Tax=Pseudobacteriovorax antillogorgiicola TaxID=1513793 RepID=A0A1Y6CUC1_9BACT|nr:GTPase HflX [Pseudobacteriovorax antillogorgiicola]TCS43619.1 GTP-binding protein HflX [Pseudobacteriovorax antillogorgiicola]SMF80032.1 GTP-binding protein HflX [Pseudobacteriovorax antillogorgiicola]
MPVDLNKKKAKAVLAGLHLPHESEFEHRSSMDELERLVTTLGFETLGRVTQKRQRPSVAGVFGKGKLAELASWTGGTGVIHGFGKGSDDEDYEDDFIESDVDDDDLERDQATIVIFDSELSPTQLSNLEEALGVEVLDRTGVILEIFSRHAQSREARLQVEIAKLAYMAPRLRLSHVGGDRQGGGIGAKGAGESAHELDRRRIRDRIAELKNQLKAIQVEQDNRRSHRKDVPLVALIGYTNAGKSSLMRKLTKTEVEGENKLFATLDTTIRTMQPETTPRILISDTVGFIKKLPHDLVASFRSTLDEALNASLLLYVVDGSDPNFKSQYEVTRKVMAEIGAEDHPSRLIVNKSDLLSEIDRARIQRDLPDSHLVSSRSKDDLNRLRDIILQVFEDEMNDFEVLVPYEKGGVIGKIRARARVLQESYDEVGTTLMLRAKPETQAWIEKQLS